MEYFQGQGGGGSGSLDWRIQRHGGTYDWNSEGISRGGGGGSRGNRQECECFAKLSTSIPVDVTFSFYP